MQSAAYLYFPNIGGGAGGIQMGMQQGGVLTLLPQRLLFPLERKLPLGSMESYHFLAMPLKEITATQQFKHLPAISLMTSIFLFKHRLKPASSSFRIRTFLKVTSSSLEQVINFQLQLLICKIALLVTFPTGMFCWSVVLKSILGKRSDFGIIVNLIHCEKSWAVVRH